MPAITMKEMLEAGSHFGHQTRRWNPKMKPYIYGARNGIHIIDLQKTIKLFREAYSFISDTVSSGQKVLFVGTKKQARDIIQSEAIRAGMFYVNGRWLGGTLTNFKTIRSSIERLKTIDRMSVDGTFQKLTKKEVARLEVERQKLQKNIGGIKEMGKLPGAIFIVDPGKEYNAVREAVKCGVPIVAIVDTNCDPEGVNYVIPGNDDALRAIQIFTSRIADACAEGGKRYEEESAKNRETRRDAGRDSGEGEKPERKVRISQPRVEEAGPKVEVVSRGSARGIKGAVSSRQLGENIEASSEDLSSKDGDKQE